MSLILTYGQCFVEEWHASCWCLGCFTFDLPRTYNRNWFCSNALMGLMFGTDELWLFFQKNIKKIHHVFLHPSSCWSRFCTDKLGTKALNSRKNILSSEQSRTVDMIAPSLKLSWTLSRNVAHDQDISETSKNPTTRPQHRLSSPLLCFFAPPCPPPPTPEPTHQFRWLLELGRLATSFLHFEAISTVDADSVRIQWFHVSCMDLVGISVLSKDNNCNFCGSFPITSTSIFDWFTSSMGHGEMNQSTNPPLVISTKLPRTPHWRCSTQVNLAEFFGKTIGYLEIYWKWVGVNDEESSTYFFRIFNFSQIHLVDLKLLETGMNMNEYHWAFFLFLFASENH